MLNSPASLSLLPWCGDLMSVWKVKVLVIQLCLTLRPQDGSPPSSSAHGSLQGRILEWASSVQLFSHVWIAAQQASLSITNSWSLLKLMSIVSVIPFNHLILSSPPALSLSQHQGLFKWVSSSHHVAKVLEFQFQHQSFQWILRMDCLDLLAVQVSLRVFSNTTVQKHQFFGVQLSPILTSLLDYWKTIALTRWTFVGKVMSLFF